MLVLSTIPGAPLPTADRWLLAGSVVTLIGGYLSMQWQNARHLARERPAVMHPTVALSRADHALYEAKRSGRDRAATLPGWRERNVLTLVPQRWEPTWIWQ